MKRYTYEVKAFVDVLAKSEEEARDKLDDRFLNGTRHDVPQLVNVINVIDIPMPRCYDIDLSDTGIDNRKIDYESEGPRGKPSGRLNLWKEENEEAGLK